MSDIPARIQDLTERIASIKAEQAEHAAGKNLFAGGRPTPADVFFNDEEQLANRLHDLERQLADLQAQSATTSANVTFEYPTNVMPDADYLAGSASEPFGEQYGTTEAKPSDPFNDPEIQAIDRRYRETIAKLNEENRKFEEGRKVEEPKEIQDLTTVPVPPVTEAKPETISDPFNDPEIKAIDRRYRETIVKLNEENAKINNTKKAAVVVGLVIAAVIGYLALRSNDEAVSPVPVTVADTSLETVPTVNVAEVTLPQASTAAAAGYTCVGDQFQLFDNSNGSLISGGGGTPPTFSTGGKPYCLANMSTYHWNDGKGSPPGTVGLRGSQEQVGPTQAQGTSGQGGAQNVNWVFVPASDAIPLLNGSYTCTDSDSATWSQNSESGGQGFCRVWVQTAEK